MSKLYQYTVFKQDGSVEKLTPCKKKTGDELRELLGGWLEVMPKDYYAPSMNRRSTIYIDEEGRFNNNNHKNPHFLDFGGEWNIVGNAVMEEVFHGEK